MKTIPDLVGSNGLILTAVFTYIADISLTYGVHKLHSAQSTASGTDIFDASTVDLWRTLLLRIILVPASLLMGWVVWYLKMTRFWGQFGKEPTRVPRELWVSSKDKSLSERALAFEQKMSGHKITEGHEAGIIDLVFDQNIVDRKTAEFNGTELPPDSM